MSKFQIIVLGVFALFIVIGVAVFATFKGSISSSNKLAAITVWGTFPGEYVNSLVSKINEENPEQISVSYIQKSKATFHREFINALAYGTAPDAILIPLDMFYLERDNVAPIPYNVFPQRTFMDTYVQEGEMYLNNNGAYALPFIVDPLVMYWNRDMFSAVGLANYPKTWEEFGNTVLKLNNKDQNGNIRKSATALGDFTNISNAREILASLFFQSGNYITKVESGTIQSAIGKEPSIVSALEFFTQFSDPNNKYYSWNRGMTNSKTAFLSQNLAIYFGLASELNGIKEKNPNLNFDIAPFPQLKSGGIKTVYGNMYGLSIVRTSNNKDSVYQIISLMNNAKYSSWFSSSIYLPSARRDVIASNSSDPYIQIFNSQALLSKTWFDIDPNKSFSIMQDLVNSITSGAKSVRNALSDANDQYDLALKQNYQ